MFPLWYGSWIEREEPLALCPDPWCRRAGTCRRGGSATLPCLRTHETMDEARERLADRIDRFMIEEGIPRVPVTPEEEDSYDFQMKLKALKDELEEREAEEMEKRRAASGM